MNHTINMTSSAWSRRITLAGLALLLSGCAPVGFYGGSVKPAANSADAIPGKPVRREFPVADIRQTSLSLSPRARTLSQSFELRRGETRSLSFLQGTRPPHSLQLTQGHPGEPATETFPLREIGKLDLLLVVDNSGSMTPHQNILAESLRPILKYMGNTNWQIGVVTTDNSCLRGGAPITRAEFDTNPAAAEARFAAAVKAGAMGSTIERGIEMAIKGLAGECLAITTPWVRPNAVTAVLIITDEENCGSASNEGCDATRAAESYKYYGPADFARMTPVGTRAFGLLHSDAACGEDYYDKNPQDYYDLVAGTKGFWEPICQTNYNTTLEKISADVGTIIVREVTLAHTPTQESLDVSVDGVKLDPATDFIASDKRITLAPGLNIDGPTPKLQVAYRHDPEPVFSDVALEFPADPTTIDVAVNGQTVAPGEWAFDAPDRRLRFLQPPPHRATVDIRWREPMPLDTSWALCDPETLAASVAVRVNGAVAAGWRWDESAGAVVFDSPPSDGAAIVVDYLRASDYTMTYERAPLPEESVVDGVELVDAISGSAIEITTTETTITVTRREDVTPGRPVTFVTRLSPAFTPDELLLHSDPLPGTLTLLVEGPDPCKDNTTIDGRKILIGCPAPDIEVIKVDFSYQAGWHSQFRLEEVSRFGEGMWTIEMDGRPLTRYGRRDNTIVLPPDVLATATIDSKVVISWAP